MLDESTTHEPAAGLSATGLAMEDVAGRTFALIGANDSWMRSMRFAFKADGSVIGHQSRDMFRWRVEEDGIAFLNRKGQVTATFRRTSAEGEPLAFLGMMRFTAKPAEYRLEEQVSASRRIADLPEVLRFAGEFGEEVNSFIPYVHWLHQTGQMTGRKIDTYAGMEPFYFFLNDDQITVTARKRGMVRPNTAPAHFLYPSGLYAHQAGMEWAPNYRARYRTDFGYGKPILVVHNKYTVEWGGVPHNFLNPETLEQIFSRFKNDYQIVFFEAARASHSARGYSVDRQHLLTYSDVEIAEKHPEVIIFGDMLEASGSAYNLLKLKVFSSAHHFITVQGGNAHMCALFPGSLVAIQHIRGVETRHAYQNGIFQFLANPRPLYLVGKNPGQFVEILDAFEDCRKIGDRVHLGPKGLDLYERYYPAPIRPW